jgi:hypothetical protein
MGGWLPRINAYLYGKHYARVTGGETPQASIAATMAKVHETNYTPGGTVMAVAGDFYADMEKQLAAAFAGL